MSGQFFRVDWERGFQRIFQVKSDYFADVKFFWKWGLSERERYHRGFFVGGGGWGRK